LFIPANRISDNWVEYFDDSFEVRRLVDLIDGKLTGVNFLEYVLPSKLEGGINNPEYLKQVKAFAQWYEKQELVVGVNRYTEILKELNQALHEGDPGQYRLPASRELAAQYQLLYELTLPLGVSTDNIIDIGKTSTRMTVSVKAIGTDKILELDRRALAWLKQNAPAIEATPGTGLGLIFAHIAERNINSLLLGTVLALVLISLLLAVVLRSWRFGLISMIPNVIPAIIAYGFWGMLLARVDMCLAIVACATLGIVVDDTVHFLHKYLHARRHLDMDAPESVSYSFRTVGKALFVTSSVLGAGFAVLGVSHMFTTVEVGTMMGITIVVALLVDFLFLPPLLLYVDRVVK
jgi:predicted RND superfamily exporter protein